MDSGEALHSAVSRNLGIALMPTFLVSGELQTGRFVRLLPEATTEDVDIRVLYPDRRLLNPRVRQFIDLLAAGIRI